MRDVAKDVARRVLYTYDMLQKVYVLDTVKLLCINKSQKNKIYLTKQPIIYLEASHIFLKASGKLLSETVINSYSKDTSSGQRP